MSDLPTHHGLEFWDPNSIGDATAHARMGGSFSSVSFLPSQLAVATSPLPPFLIPPPHLLLPPCLPSPSSSESSVLPTSPTSGFYSLVFALCIGLSLPLCALPLFLGRCPQRWGVISRSLWFPPPLLFFSMGRHTIGAGWFRRLGSSRDGDGEGVQKSQRRSPKWRRRLLSVFSPSAWRWRRPDFRFNLKLHVRQSIIALWALAAAKEHD
ncbi:hypothetical protein Taro_054697 [Colocasia esculenta]|uniref:Uncharacterized protein n=1 Tax=Colocasia esculenta TaxID=4460 RepID=A0A843XR71_COLES|nr:hypothetical protein [Colocasia esculenta]